MLKVPFTNPDDGNNYYLSETTLSTFPKIIHEILATEKPPLLAYYYHPPSTDGETEAQNVSNLTKVTVLVSQGAGTQIQAARAKG